MKDYLPYVIIGLWTCAALYIVLRPAIKGKKPMAERTKKNETR